VARDTWVQKRVRDAIETRRPVDSTAPPSERELCNAFQLSRVTIRKAMEALVSDGLIEPRRGAGTFVTNK
jgi:GntR family transcriptional regulator